ncbi:MAG: PQQ-dependent sugar dehydrogenase [Akkermansiaceae bacterium]
MMRSWILLLLGACGPLWAQAPRWDDAALRNAGVAPFICEPVRAFAEGSFENPVMTVPYREGKQEWVLVLGRKGQLWSCEANDKGEAPHLSFDLARHLTGEGGHPGRLGLTAMGALFDREFPKRRYLYLRFSVRGGRKLNKLVRFEVTKGAPLGLGKMEEILVWESNGHDGGDLAWGPRDGYLYLSSGDGSSPGDPDNIGQQTDRIRGSILRLDVHGEEGERLYRIPKDNPFVGVEGVRSEIWCYGLRNPWRRAFHPENGELWLGDNGDEHWELVHKVRRGANFGWSAFEGSHVFRASNPLRGPTLQHTPPEVEHPHTEMRSVIGGLFYRGSKMPNLREHYLYACYFTKQLWAFSYREGVVGTPFVIADLPEAPVHFVEDHDREVLVTCLEGGVFRLQAVAKKVRGRPWPGLLSETGLFRNVAHQEPAPGVVPYRTNAQAWFDGATTERFLAVPKGQSMKQGGGQQLVKSWVFTEGTAIAQTLSIEEQRVETQVLYFDGRWQGYTYRWNEEGTDAVLVEAGGAEAELRFQSGLPHRWRFHSRAECMTCHTQKTNFAISVTTSQLDLVDAGGVNQLDRLLADGYLAQSPALRSLKGQPRPNPHDEVLTLGLRARSYLDLNCAHCHRETGLGGRAGFQLMSHLSLAETGIVDAKAVVGMALGPDSKLVVPGVPERSELFARMARRGAGQMPLIGSQVVDPRGVELIRKWIRSLGEK